MTFADIFAWLADFFDAQFFMLFIGTGILFLAMFLMWWLYYTLSRRNIFLLKAKKGHDRATTGDHAAYIMKYFFLFPLFTFLGFLVFALCLFLLIKPTTIEMQTNIIFIAIILVSTIRVSAYIHEALAEDLSKLVPLSVLTVVLTTQSLSSIFVTEEQFQAFFTLIPGFLKYLLFIIILEAILRGGTWMYSNMSKDAPE